ncbi:uncharacterized protein N7483_009975 [Penicillium malachiteum]|uniref:uncharacterized protein n=1 Tax=Penicillium malachiteum TaxID=1324776 RepID=UPI002548CA09|nr:uncharacterized protein N7483_009975 [Penicillium malachiteum]KAJ5718893.1 hypothetical protein N7483_009975 [Penicillium malachiteum]
MPIPTRSVSLREPRKTSNIARPTPTGSKAPVRPTTASTTSSADSASLSDYASNRGRTLLPQRTNLSRDDVSEGQTRLPPPETKQSREETSPQRRQRIGLDGKSHGIPSSRPATTATATAATRTTTTTGAAVPTRRQSLLRPATLNLSSTRSNVSAPSKTTTPSVTPPSPRKPSMRPPMQSSAPRPPSPKKSDMPPPRSTRSASLRQPLNTANGSTPAARGHTRHRSQMTPSSAKPTQSESAQKPRPGFSTYQQHYSPKKPIAKPPTPTPAETPSSNGSLISTSWPDIAALQTELLQLSLFHSNSLERHSEWKSESEAQLRKKYDGVSGQYRSLMGDEQMHQHQLNVQALDYWAQNCREHHGPHGFPEQIQILSQVLQEVTDLTGINGRYTQEVAVFEDWIDQAESIRNNRERSRILDGTGFIDPLSEDWKEQVQHLHAKLELCSRQLQTLDILGFGEVERLEQSALTRVAQSLMESIKLMLQEIRAMRSLESDIVSAERETVSQLATQLASFPPDRPAVRVGIWSV